MEEGKKHKAAACFQKACVKKPPDPLAEYYLGICMERGLGVKADINEAAVLYYDAAKAGIPQAQHNLAVFYEHGRGLKQNVSEALRWYRLAAKAGLKDSEMELFRLETPGYAAEATVKPDNVNTVSTIETSSGVNDNTENAIISGFTP